MTATLKHILIAEQPQQKMLGVYQAMLIAGKGIEGDRYFAKDGSPEKSQQSDANFEVTLIEQEQIDWFNNKTGFDYSGSDFRRNLVTQGVALNDLVNQHFQIGNVVLKGIELCEPCGHLAKLLGREVLDHMVHKAGLRAQIISSGTIVKDDIISTIA